jgi:hypothetical protein
MGWTATNARPHSSASGMSGNVQEDGSDLNSDVPQIADFLRRWRSCFYETASRADAEFKETFKTWSSGLAQARKADHEYERIHAPHFNLLRLVAGKGLELAYSALIAELLDPRGSHGQGALFLREFLRICVTPALHRDIELVASASDVSVKTERQIYNGRLDIVLETSEASFLLAIENKVDAADQEDQLKRYSEWLDGKKSRFKMVLMYLAPEGRPGPPGVTYVAISYQQHIAAWLRSCARLLRPVRVKQGIEQFAEEVEGMGAWGE